VYDNISGAIQSALKNGVILHIGIGL